MLNEAAQVIGVVSESDLLNKLALGGENHMPGKITGILRHKQLEKARGVIACDLMTAPPVTVAPDDIVEHAGRIMYLRGIKRLPVVDADGHLAGIVSRPTCWPSTAARTPRSPRTLDRRPVQPRSPLFLARSTSR